MLTLNVKNYIKLSSLVYLSNSRHPPCYKPTNKIEETFRLISIQNAAFKSAKIASSLYLKVSFWCFEFSQDTTLFHL